VTEGVECLLLQVRNPKFKPQPPCTKKKKKKERRTKGGAEGVVQVVECLPSKYEALSSSPRTNINN
jgi:hypothetical protein